LRVNLIDIDGSYPNLVLMKLSAYWKSQGAEVTLNSCRPADHVFISVVFSANMPKARKIQRALGGSIGGSGTGDYSVVLPPEIEHICPDYSLYGLDYSMGFTSRGCCRNCSFCIVPAKEGKTQEHSPLDEFVRHQKVVLLDNNFLASPLWREKLQGMIDQKLKVDFNQGLDIRLVNEDKARLLAELSPPYLRFAWDSMGLKPEIKRGIRLLRDAGYPINRNRIGFYVLTGYDATPKQDLYRLDYLHKLNINTHVQPFVKNRENNRLSRWGNSPMIWNKCRFSGYTG
jgi:hypothetical protein